MNTFKLWLEPDELFPQFKRLAWAEAEVSIQDILLRGVHPYIGKDRHLSVMEAFLAKINAVPAKFGTLEEQGLCADVTRPEYVSWGNTSNVDRMFKRVQESVLFVHSLTYLELLEFAKAHLRSTWSHGVAKCLLERSQCSLPEMRRLLKAKDKSIKLSSYADVDGYNLGHLLRLEDFEAWDRLVLEKAFPTLNFRRADVLDQITDDQGRLRLVDDIASFSLTETYGHGDYAGVVWHGKRRGTAATLRPDIGGSFDKRQCATEFAKEWRIDDGELVFKTTVDRVARMVEGGVVTIDFPNLDYMRDYSGPAAKAVAAASFVQAFEIRGYPTNGCTTSDLKNVLRHYEVSMTGTKAELLRKLAKLASKEYAKLKDELDAYFEANRFVHIRYRVKRAKPFPLLEDRKYLQNLLLVMYALKHLRGSAVLEPSHENDAYNEEELAAALIGRNLTLDGAFLPVT